MTERDAGDEAFRAEQARQAFAGDYRELKNLLLSHLDEAKAVMAEHESLPSALRCETHYPEDRSKRQPPQSLSLTLRPGERVVCVETFRDAYDDVAARVWIELLDD